MWLSDYDYLIGELYESIIIYLSDLLLMRSEVQDIYIYIEVQDISRYL